MADPVTLEEVARSNDPVVITGRFWRQVARRAETPTWPLAASIVPFA